MSVVPEHVSTIRNNEKQIINGRGDAKTNVSKILYYGVIQNALFAGLQTALFAAIASDDEEDFTNRFGRVTDSMLDSFLYGWGMSGTALATGLDVIQEFLKQEQMAITREISNSKAKNDILEKKKLKEKVKVLNKNDLKLEDQYNQISKR